MARGNGVIVKGDPSRTGGMVEGIVNAGETFYPGMVVQLDPTQALQGGRHVCKIYAPGTDGDRPRGPYIIVIEDSWQGKLMTDSYTAGQRFFGYVPLPGDELNLLLKDIAGTGDDHTAGEMLIVDNGTGKFIATTGSPECEPAMLLETVTDPAADTLAWCAWSGI